MDIQTLWIIALSIATPVAGVIGFAIQIREVKKGRLEIEKLQLEIDALRAKATASNSRIVQVTTAEVQRFTARDDIMFSRKATGVELLPARKTSLKEIAMVGSAVLGLLLLAAYVLYDIYRFVAWLSTVL